MAPPSTRTQRLSAINQDADVLARPIGYDAKGSIQEGEEKVGVALVEGRRSC
jgi:hypothetical protein